MPQANPYSVAEAAFEAQLAKLQKRLADLGYPVEVASRWRTAKEQEAHYNKSRKKGTLITNADGTINLSNHQLGIAADLRFTDPWTHRKFNVRALTGNQGGETGVLGEVAKAEGLTWGGDWKSPYDPGHVEGNPPFTGEVIRPKTTRVVDGEPTLVSARRKPVAQPPAGTFVPSHGQATTPTVTPPPQAVPEFADWPRRAAAAPAPAVAAPPPAAAVTAPPRLFPEEVPMARSQRTSSPGFAEPPMRRSSPYPAEAPPAPTVTPPPFVPTPLEDFEIPTRGPGALPPTPRAAAPSRRVVSADEPAPGPLPVPSVSTSETFRPAPPAAIPYNELADATRKAYPGQFSHYSDEELVHAVHQAYPKEFPQYDDPGKGMEALPNEGMPLPPPIDPGRDIALGTEKMEMPGGIGLELTPDGQGAEVWQTPEGMADIPTATPHGKRSTRLTPRTYAGKTRMVTEGAPQGPAQPYPGAPPTSLGRPGYESGSGSLSLAATALPGTSLTEGAARGASALADAALGRPVEVSDPFHVLGGPLRSLYGYGASMRQAPGDIPAHLFHGLEEMERGTTTPGVAAREVVAPAAYAVAGEMLKAGMPISSVIPVLGIPVSTEYGIDAVADPWNYIGGPIGEGTKFVKYLGGFRNGRNAAAKVVREAAEQVATAQRVARLIPWSRENFSEFGREALLQKTLWHGQQAMEAVPPPPPPPATLAEAVGHTYGVPNTAGELQPVQIAETPTGYQLMNMRDVVMEDGSPVAMGGLPIDEEDFQHLVEQGVLQWAPAKPPQPPSIFGPQGLPIQVGVPPGGMRPPRPLSPDLAYPEIVAGAYPEFPATPEGLPAYRAAVEARYAEMFTRLGRGPVLPPERQLGDRVITSYPPGMEPPPRIDPSLGSPAGDVNVRRPNVLPTDPHDPALAATSTIPPEPESAGPLLDELEGEVASSLETRQPGPPRLTGTKVPQLRLTPPPTVVDTPLETVAKQLRLSRKRPGPPPNVLEPGLPLDRSPEVAFPESAPGQGSLDALRDEPLPAGPFPRNADYSNEVDVWKRPDPKATKKRLIPSVRRELQRILDEYDAQPFQENVWSPVDPAETGWTGNAGGGHWNVQAGHGGAPVHHDILGFAPVMKKGGGGPQQTRAAVVAHIKRLLKTGVIDSNVQEGAVRVAERRAVNDLRDLSKPILAPWWEGPPRNSLEDMGRTLGPDDVPFGVPEGELSAEDAARAAREGVEQVGPPDRRLGQPPLQPEGEIPARRYDWENEIKRFFTEPTGEVDVDELLRNTRQFSKETITRVRDLLKQALEVPEGDFSAFPDYRQPKPYSLASLVDDPDAAEAQLRGHLLNEEGKALLRERTEKGDWTPEQSRRFEEVSKEWDQNHRTWLEAYEAYAGPRRAAAMAETGEVGPPPRAIDEVAEAAPVPKGEVTPPPRATQQRLPGDVGDVQDLEIPTPTEDLPFQLGREVAEPAKPGVQPGLFGEEPIKPKVPKPSKAAPGQRSLFSDEVKRFITDAKGEVDTDRMKEILTEVVPQQVGKWLKTYRPVFKDEAWYKKAVALHNAGKPYEAHREVRAAQKQLAQQAKSLTARAFAGADRTKAQQAAAQLRTEAKAVMDAPDPPWSHPEVRQEKVIPKAYAKAVEEDPSLAAQGIDTLSPPRRGPLPPIQVIDKELGTEVATGILHDVTATGILDNLSQAYSLKTGKPWRKDAKLRLFRRIADRMMREGGSTAETREALRIMKDNEIVPLEQVVRWWANKYSAHGRGLGELGNWAQKRMKEGQILKDWVEPKFEEGLEDLVMGAEDLDSAKATARHLGMSDSEIESLGQKRNVMGRFVKEETGAVQLGRSVPSNEHLMRDVLWGKTGGTGRYAQGQPKGTMNAVENMTRAIMVSQLPTAERNLWTGAMRYAVGAVDDLEASLVAAMRGDHELARRHWNYGKRKLQGLTRPGGVAQRPWHDAMGAIYRFNADAMTTLKGQPLSRRDIRRSLAVMEQMARNPNIKHAAAVDFLGDVGGEAWAKAIAAQPTSTLGKLGKKALSPEVRNYILSFNRFQEYTMRSVSFDAAFRAELDNLGFDADELLMKDFADLVVEVGPDRVDDALRNATYLSLDYTFAAGAYPGSPVDVLLNQFSKHWAARVPYPFPRFNFADAPRFIYDHSPAALLEIPMTAAYKLGLTEKPYGRLAKGLAAENLRRHAIPKLGLQKRLAEGRMESAFLVYKQRTLQGRQMAKEFRNLHRQMERAEAAGKALPGQKFPMEDRLTELGEQLGALEEAKERGRKAISDARAQWQEIVTTERSLKSTVDKANRASAPSFDQYIARQMTGLGMLGAAWIMRSSPGAEGTEWYEYRVKMPESMGGRTVNMDFRAFAPFAQYLFVADTLEDLRKNVDWDQVHNILHNRDPHNDRDYSKWNPLDWNQAIRQSYNGPRPMEEWGKDFVEAFLSISRTAGATLSLADLITGRQTDKGTLQNLIDYVVGSTGQFLSRVTVPLRQVNDITALWNPEADIARIPEDSFAGRLIGPTVANIPYLRETIPPKVSATTGEPIATLYPTLRTLTGVTLRVRQPLEVEMKKLGLKFSDATPKQLGDRELDNRVATEYAKLLNKVMPQVMANKNIAKQPLALRKQIYQSIFNGLKDGAIGKTYSTLAKGLSTEERKGVRDKLTPAADRRKQQYWMRLLDKHQAEQAAAQGGGGTAEEPEPTVVEAPPTYQDPEDTAPIDELEGEEPDDVPRLPEGIQP